MRPRLAIVVAALLMAAVGWAEEPVGPAPPQTQPTDFWSDPRWMIAASASGIFASGDAGLDNAADEAFRRSADVFDDDVRQIIGQAKQGTGLKAAGKLATLVGRAGAYAGIVGAASSGDWAGMGQEGINAFLGDVAAAAGATLAVAVLLPATASVAAITAVGVAGAVVFSTGYDWIVKPVVDAGFDSGVRTSQDRAAAEQRVERARIWAAEAETACGDARRWLAEGRRGVGEEGTAEETARWLGEESAAVEGRIARARELAAQARASAAPAEAAADAAAAAAQGEELATDAVGYADDACRVAVEMAGTRQADAQRIWSRSDRYLDERAQTVASRSEGADEKAREAAARAEEIDALRREAAAAAAGAGAEVGRLEAEVAGGRARLEQLAGGVRRARVWLERAAAAAEACDGQRGKAIALLDKPPWNGYPEVQSVLHEVRPIAPPYAEVEALADAISEADAVVASATRRLEEIAAAVAGWRRELGAALPAPDPGRSSAPATRRRGPERRGERRRGPPRAPGAVPGRRGRSRRRRRSRASPPPSPPQGAAGSGSVASRRWVVRPCRRRRRPRRRSPRSRSRTCSATRRPRTAGATSRRRARRSRWRRPACPAIRTCWRSRPASRRRRSARWRRSRRSSRRSRRSPAGSARRRSPPSTAPPTRRRTASRGRSRRSRAGCAKGSRRSARTPTSGRALPSAACSGRSSES
ncbi:MAG: hypothetical protein M5U13_03955 [Thermoanaerobaculia bacterium]|nr:hypothetical protein [Thermoanaerobaculia bacterium]